MKTPIELIEAILIETAKDEAGEFDPLPYLRVAPGLTELRRAVFNLRIRPAFLDAVKSMNVPLLRSCANKEGHLDFIAWWFSLGLRVPQHSRNLCTLHVGALELWRHSGAKLKDKELPVDEAAEAVAPLWEYVIVSALQAGQPQSLAWILAHHVPRDDPRWLTRPPAINHAANAGKVNVLEWLAANLPREALQYDDVDRWNVADDVRRGGDESDVAKKIAAEPRAKPSAPAT
ncbi:hypothetical protein H9P43_007637 [Blastocladiella emersonii ATCC 22665]|nr:hypothetical protein H9P43_007637 [Blastocladiella emersonii ATCC 22665]